MGFSFSRADSFDQRASFVAIQSINLPFQRPIFSLKEEERIHPLDPTTLLRQKNLLSPVRMKEREKF